MAGSTARSFFDALRRNETEFDGYRLLYEVDARFHEPAMVEELRWRLEVLNELAEQYGLGEEFEALRDALTRIFTEPGDEHVVLARLRDLTYIQVPGGRRVDLRRLRVGTGKVYNEQDYRKALSRKIANTRDQVVNLTASYPQEEPELRKLSAVLQGLAERAADPALRASKVRRMEERVRESEGFTHYEALKQRMLRDWLARYTGASEEALAGLNDAEIARLVAEHQRHQVTQLVKAGVRPLDEDVSQHLGVHDTLEGEFHNEAFWAGANVSVRRGFVRWVTDAVMAYGMAAGRRYVFCRSEHDTSLYLLLGLGLPAVPHAQEGPIELVPYAKPFTRKAGYLLEIRRRQVGGIEAYHHELIHYTLPFIYAFEHVPEVTVQPDLRNFFNSRY